MLARLWWKESRTLWPIWLALGLFAAGVQALALRSGLPAFRQGLLTPVAMGWAALYAFAAAAVSFAGEREARTLRLLDALAVDRRTLWLGKASFALATTAALAFAFLLVSMIGIEQRDDRHYGLATVAVGSGALLFEAIGWGLLWSALLGNPLVAAALAIATTSAAVGLVTGRFTLEPGTLAELAPLRVGLGLAALAASYLVMTTRPRPGRLARLRRVEPGRAPAPPSRPRGSTLRAVRSLSWQSRRDSWATWAVLLAAGVLLPLYVSGQRGRLDPSAALVVATLAGLAAGVSAPAGDHARGPGRFLLHHGVDPRLVWAVRLATWGGQLAAFFGAMLALAGAFGAFAPGSLTHAGIPGVRTPADQLSLMVAPALTAFAVGQLVALAIRSRITAALVAFLAAWVVVVPPMGLAALGMLPPPALLLTPAALLLAGGLWARDAMGPGGPGRWARLAGLVGLPLALLVGGYVGYRAFGLPLIEPPVNVAFLASEVVPPEQDAAELYRRAAAVLRSPPRERRADLLNDQIIDVIDHGWDPNAQQAVRWLDKNCDALALLREAALRPRAQFGRITPSSTLTGQEDPRIYQMFDLARLVALDARERFAARDLDGAWADILLLRRMAHHLADATPTLAQVLRAAAVEDLALGLTYDWAAADGQTPARLHAAIDELRARPVPAPRAAAEAIRVHYVRTMATLDRPAAEIATELGGVDPKTNPGLFLLYEYVLAAPWERERARRLVRLETAAALELADLTPDQRARVTFYEGRLPSDLLPMTARHRITAAMLQRAEQSTPLGRLLVQPSNTLFRALDRLAARRAATVLVLALRSWQLRHDGRYPDQLIELVPSELPALPPDPFSGEPFRYAYAVGQSLPRPGPRLGDRELVPIEPGRRLISSVGPYLRDDQGRFDNDTGAPGGDMVIPLPPEGRAGR